MKHWSRQSVVVALLLTSTLAAAVLTSMRPSDQLSQPLESIPTEFAGWKVVQSQTLSDHVLSVLLPTSYISRTYEKSGRQLDLFVSYYAQQRAGESMHSPKNCLPASGWEIWRYDSALLPVDGTQFKVNKYFIENNGRRSIVYYWYQSKERIVASEYVGKILLLRDALLDGHTAGSIVRVIVSDVPGAAEEAAAFSSALIPQVRRCLTR
jgi:EpsI family protein